jgi:hypothetical protein
LIIRNFFYRCTPLGLIIEKEQLTQEIVEDKKRVEKASSTIANLKTSKDKQEILKNKLSIANYQS